MRFFTAILLFIFFTSIVDAAYLKTIRLGAFSENVDAQRELRKLKKFMKKHDNIVRLQEKWGFEANVRKSGKYHAIVVEPLRSRKVLQELIDTLRIKYKDAYVTTLKVDPAKTKKIEEKKKPVVKKEPEPKKEVLEKKEVLKEKEIKKEIPKVEEVSKNEELKSETKDITVVEKKKEDANESLEKTQKIQEEVIKTQEELSPKENIKLENNETNQSEPVVVIEKKQELIKVEESVKKTVHEEYKEQLKQLPKDKEFNKFEDTSAKTPQHNYLFEILFVLAVILILILLRKLMRLKKESKEYLEQIESDKQTIEQMSSQSENINKFLSYINHEIKTPITAIDGMTQLMLDQGLSKFEEDYARRIKSSASNILDIMDDTLDMTKIQSGELEIKNDEFNINDTIRYVLTTILAQAHQEGKKVSFDMDSAIPSHVIGDSLRLSQVLINLLSKMMQCSGNSEINLHIEKVVSYADTLQLKFVISSDDNEFSEKIESIVEEEYQKVGLSVLISKQLIEMMQGEIFIESDKELCNSIAFTTVVMVKNSAEKRHYRLPSKELMNKSVLIVDAHEKTISSLSKYLEYFHYKIHSIPSFEAALQEDKMDFDLVIANQSNLTTPAIRKLKEIVNHNTKIVVMSELYKNIQNNFFQDIDVAVCLKTPCTQQDVLDMIIQVYAMKTLNTQSTEIKLGDYSSKRVIVAEDNLLTQKVIADLLSGSGIELTFVTNGQEVVELVKADNVYDLILMDLHMPILNGYKASEEIRKENKNNSTHIWALNTQKSDSVMEKILASGMQGEILKPLDSNTFYKTVTDILNNPSDVINIMSISREDEHENIEEYKELFVNSGLSNFDGDISLYKTTLTDFKAMHLNSAGVVAKLVQDHYLTEVRSLIKDVVDTATKIGAYNLAENIAAMEHEFDRENEENYTQFIEAYQLSLENLFEDIDSYMKKA